MRLLIDQNLAARVAALLRDAGHDVVHVAECGMAAADDDQVLGLAVAEARATLLASALPRVESELGAPAPSSCSVAPRCGFGPSRCRREDEGAPIDW